MSGEQIRKIKKQPRKTWCGLRKRLVELVHPFEELFDDPVYLFLVRMATSLSSSVGYVSVSVITTTAFLAARVSKGECLGTAFPLNLFTIFMGPPSSGKSQVSALENNKLSFNKQAGEK